MGRKYQSIWEQLKLKGICVITADPVLHARIKKAVTKEKYNDVVYKVEWDMKESGTLAPVLSVSYGKDANGKLIKNQLIFKLKKPITLGDL